MSGGSLIRVGFTGTRVGMTAQQISEVTALFEKLNPPPMKGTLHHGDCMGCDAQAHILARKVGYNIVIHPPSKTGRRAYCKGDSVWPAKDYLVRNRDIVDNCDRMIATPKGTEEELRSGTWTTIRYAKAVGRMMYIVFPNGEVQVFVSHSGSDRMWGT